MMKKVTMNLKCVFNHNIRLRSIVQLESNLITGQFTVVKAVIRDNFTMQVTVIARG